MELEVLRGCLRRIKYQGKGYWSVAEVELESRSVATVTGAMPGCQEGDHVEFRGSWEEDERWGRQFKAQQVVPTPRSGIEEFLKLLPELGPRRAAEIRSAFGDDVWRVIEDEPHRLKDIVGLTSDRIERIKTEYARKLVDRDLLVWCTGVGISAYHVGLIRAHFGEEALETIRNNPYQLVAVMGIGFLTADRIALKAGQQAASAVRAMAAVEYVIKEAESIDGSTAVDGGLILACLRGQQRGPGGVETPVSLSPSLPDEISYEAIRSLVKSELISVEDRLMQRTVTKQMEVAVAAALARRARRP